MRRRPGCPSVLDPHVFEIYVVGPGAPVWSACPAGRGRNLRAGGAGRGHGGAAERRHVPADGATPRQATPGRPPSARNSSTLERSGVCGPARRVGLRYGHRDDESRNRRDGPGVRLPHPAGARGQDPAVLGRVPGLPRHDGRAASRVDARRRRHPRRRDRPSGRARDPGDGQDLRGGEGGGRQVRAGVPLVRRPLRRTPRRPPVGARGRTVERPGLHPVPAVGSGAGDHAVELSPTGRSSVSCARP